MPDGKAPTDEATRPAAASASERPIVLWGGLSLFLVGWATVSVTNASETLFLKRVGVEQLPLVFLINSGLLAATTYFIGRWVAVREHGRALTLTLWIAAACLVPIWLGLLADVPGAIAVLVISAKQIQALALLVFWVAMGGWVDGRQAKRLVPPMMAGGTLGAAFGSFASGSIGAGFGISALVLVAAGSLALAATTTYALRRRTSSRIEWPRRSRRDERAESPGFRDLWRDSGLFRLLATGALLAGLLAPILYYLFSVAADAATRGMDGEQDLLRLYGMFRGWMNVAILALQLGGTSWLFRRIGVPRAALLAPAVYVLGFVGFATVGGLGIAIAAMAAASLQDKALGEPAERTLATLFPERTRPTVAALLDGMLKRGGGALGNLVVLATIAGSLETTLPTVAVPLAFAWLAAGIALARVYPSLLLEAATHTGFARGDAVPDADLIDARTTRLLEASLQDPDPERCAAACDLAAESPTGVAATVTAGALRSAPAGNVPVLLRTLTRIVETGTLTGTKGRDTSRAMLDAVAGRPELDPTTKAKLIILASSLAPIAGDDVRRTLGTLGDDADAPAPLKLATELALHEDDAGEILRHAVREGTPESRHVAVEALRASLLAAERGDADLRRTRLGLLVDLLADEAERPNAARALADVAAHHGEGLAAVTPAFGAYQEDPDPSVRAALLRFLGHAGSTDHARWAIARLSSLDAGEVAAAQGSLRALGPLGIDLILEAFHCDCRYTREALLPVLRDIPVDTATLRSLADGELEGIRRVLELEHALAAATTSGLVRQRLNERVDEGTRAALSLFAALYHDDRIAELGPLLERVRGGRERAVLLEALEALLPADQATTLLELLETSLHGHPIETPEEYAADRESALRSALHDADSLTRAFVAAALEESELDRLGGVPKIQPDEPAYALAPIHPIAHSSPSADDGQEHAMLSGVEIVLHLRSLALFERLSTRELTELAGIVREVTHPGEARIVHEGDFDDCMYLIVAGKVKITRSGVLLGELGPRDFFGEMAILDGETRSATVTSASKVRLLRIDRTDLLRVMDERPGIAISICQTLSRRVRELNDTLRDLRQENRPASTS